MSMKASHPPRPRAMPRSNTVVCWLMSGEAARRRVSSNAPVLIGKDTTARATWKVHAAG
jgi:hypothetical protein